MKLKKINGFTTMELSIVMLMSGLISSLAYGGYVLFGRQINKHTKITEQTLNTQLLMTLLKKDTYTADKVQVNGNFLAFEKGKNTVQYSFEDETYILRTQAGTADTFKLEYTNFYTKLKDQTIITNNLIDEFGFTVNYKKNESTISFAKNYGNKLLIEEELAHGY